MHLAAYTNPISETMARIRGMYDRWCDAHPTSATAPLTNASVHALRSAYEPKTTYQFYTTATRTAIVAAMVAGEPVATIHARTSIAEATLRRWGRDAGLTYAARRLPAQIKTAALAAIAHGEPPTPIAHRLNIHPSTVSKWATAAGYHFTRGTHHPRLLTRSVA